jgi:hypothetical protein
MELLSPLVIEGGTATTTAGAFATTELHMPVSVHNNIGIVIVGCDFQQDYVTDVPAAGTTHETMESMLLEEDIAAVPDIDNDDVIAMERLLAQGDATNILYTNRHEFGLSGKLMNPLLEGWRTLAPSIFIGTFNSNAAATSTVRFKIYFYVVKFTDDEFRELAIREAYT